MTKPNSLREEMPLVTAFIDDLRAAFGADQINASIKAGINGAGTFYASENGREIGSKSQPGGVVLTADQLYLCLEEKKDAKK